MNAQFVSLAKTARPRLTGIVARRRLFGRIESALGNALWITGPPGCGKTALAASYFEQNNPASLWYQLDEGDADVASFFYYLGLAAGERGGPPLPQITPEYHAGLPAFSRRYFQALYQRLGPSFAIVFDGYSEIPAHSALHDVMRIALDELPPGGSVVVISRRDPPPAMARLRANRALEVIGWSELQLTREETGAITSQRGLQLARPRLDELYEKTQGWAAGLILMLQQASANDTLAAPSDLSTPELIFEYLAGEIFQKTDAPTRDLMLATAYVSQITPEMARQLTGNDNAGTLLAELYRNNCFLALKQQAYQYHPLLREFLLTRANESLDRERRTQLRRRSAELSLAEGWLADALLLLREVGDSAGIVSIIETHASAMLDRGMGETLAQWINFLSNEIRQRNPWTIYWLAVSRVSISPRESRLLYQQAYELFGAQSEADLKGQLLAGCGAMDAILYELDDFSLLDRWIADTARLLSEHPEVLSPALEARVASSLSVSMSVRQPHHPDLERWVERAHAASLALADPNLRLAVGQRVALTIAWAGHYPKAWQVIQDMRAAAAGQEISPFVLGMLKLTEATYFMLTAQGEACLNAVKEGLEIERASEVRVLTRQLLAYGAGGALASGDLAGAQKLLEESAALPGVRARFDSCLHHFCAAWLAMLKHDRVAASQQQRLALRAAVELGSPHFEALCRMAAAHVLYEDGETRNALAHFQQVYDIARRIRNHLLEYTGLMTYAYIALESGRRPRSGLRALRLALELGKPRNYVNFLLWRPEMLSRLCSHALEAGIEREFVGKLIRGNRLALDASQMALADWPWAFRVRTFGSFRLLRNGEAVTFTGKAQRRPLDLLKVLAAFGGREVTEERVAAALWPRIDGDSAHRSLTMTLHRLRKLLGEDRAVRLSEGKLTLDGRFVWLDTWAFEQITLRIEQILRRPREIIDDQQLVELCDRLVGLYPAPFLAGDPDAPWNLAPRERLRHRFVRAVAEVSRYWQQADKAARAVDLLERALEADPASEGLYRNLIASYVQLGRGADAVETYERCCKALKTMLDSEPSAELRTLHESLLGGPGH